MRITIPSDAWDSGNYLTHFHEVIEECEECGGTGVVEDNEGQTMECEGCEGLGIITYLV